MGGCERQNRLHCKGRVPLAQLKGASPTQGPLLTPKPTAPLNPIRIPKSWGTNYLHPQVSAHAARAHRTDK